MIDPEKLEYYFRKNEKKNFKFRTFLKMHASDEEFDRQCRELHEKYYSEEFCRQCRNCCRKMNAVIPEKDIEKDAAFLQLDKETFMDTYLKGYDVFEDGYKAKHVPCDFLRDDGECMLGECRPVSCKLYPYTDQEGRLEGLLSMIDNTEICPVVYHIYEDLKIIYGFR